MFLLSTRAGGQGITLTAADTVIIYGGWGWLSREAGLCLHLGAGQVMFGGKDDCNGLWRLRCDCHSTTLRSYFGPGPATGLCANFPPTQYTTLKHPGWSLL